MSALNLADIQVLLVEPNEKERLPLHQGLLARGIKGAAAVSSVEEAASIARKRLIDMTIADAELPAGDAITFNRSIRVGQMGRNPFLVSVCTLANTLENVVRQAAHDGPDLVLAKPVTIGKLLDRLTSVIHSRPSFLVTDAYVGPDRPQIARPQENATRVEVPNTLADKALERFDVNRAVSAIDAARSLVERLALTQAAQTISTLTHQIVNSFDTGTLDESANPALSTLFDRSREIARRLKGTQEESVAEMCMSVMKVSVDLQRAIKSPAVKDVRLLQNLGMAIHMSITSERQVEHLSTRIAKSVMEAKFRRVAKQS
ncbi:MAG: response regulator [Alphaproteobacteria bacterium]|nr:response regulator [Alphaproteobacteria bacterium]